MKKYKKLLAVILSVIMMLSLSVSNGMLVYAEKDAVATESVEDSTKIEKRIKEENTSPKEEQTKKEDAEEIGQEEKTESEEMNSGEADKENDEAKTEADSEEETKEETEESSEDTEEVEQDTEDNEDLKKDDEKTEAEKESSESQGQKEEAEKVDKTESKTEEETSEKAEETSSTMKEETTAEESSVAAGEANRELKEEKELIKNDGISTFSMRPMTQVKAYLAFNNVSEEDIKAMPVSRLIASLQDKDGNKISLSPDAEYVWINFKMDDDNIDRFDQYTIDSDKTVDLSEASNVIGYQFEMIVGSGNQLNLDNVRYIVKVYTGYPEEFSFELYSQPTSSSRIKIEPKREQFVKSDSNITSSNGKIIPAWSYAWVLEEGDYINLYLGAESKLEEHPDVNVKIYETSDYLENENPTEITNQILNQKMEETGAGYRLKSEGTSLFVEYYIDGVQIDCLVLNFLITGSASEIKGDILTEVDGKKESVVKSTNLSFEIESDLSEKQEYVLKSGYSADEEYYFTFDAINGLNENVNDKIVKAVEGIYNSLEEAEGQPDIKNALLSEGYKANYGGDGKEFTLFFKEKGNFSTRDVYTFSIKVIEDEKVYKDYSSAPVVGEKDPWFRITGANDINGNKLSTYIVENGKSVNMDTMYGYGYQTIFIEDPSITEIEPEIWFIDSNDIKVTDIFIDGGKPFKEGDTIKLSGTETNVAFHVTIKDNEGEPHTKNYNVAFVKKSSGPKLYVVNPKGDGENDPVRSVFLDEYFESKHDIFIANIGDEELTGLKVELDATNVKLDSYWTVGGNGSDTLAPFTTTVSSSNEYEELPNIAKIRLLPDGDGEIEGTLTISADDQEPIVIKLSGRAQNPKIVTSSLDNAVKFVPYSYLITTDNMYDWTSVHMEITDGELPAGLELYEETGEIYGVPQETGVFSITVVANFTSETYSFPESTVELTLTVNDNTNDNVYNATDDGYAILDSVGVDVNGTHDYVVTSIEDTVFRSEGVLEEFEGLWLNGEKLVEGVDYTAESGSTKITVNAQTLDGKSDRNGTNTIAAEFRTNDDSGNKLKRTAQNYRLNLSTDDENADNDRPGNNDGSNSNQNGNTTGNNNSTQNGSNTSSGNSSNNNTSGRDDTNDAGGSGGTNTGNNGGAGNGFTGTGNNGNTGTIDTIDGVNVITHIVNADNKGLSGYTVEIHSTPQTATTDQSGYASFKDIDFGNHTIYLKSNDGKELASKEVAFVSGDATSLSGSSITAVKGSTVTVNLKYENGALNLMSVQSGDQSVPTGDKTNMGLWMTLFVLALSGVAVVTWQRKRNYERGI